MLERAISYNKEYSPFIMEHIDYVKKSDWTLIDERRRRIDEYGLHVGLIKQFFSFIKYVLAEAGSDFSESATLKKSLKKVADCINFHIERSNRYLKIERWQDYDGEDSAKEKHEEIEFQNKIVADLVNNRGALSELPLDEERREVVTLRLFGEAIVPLPMRAMIEKQYPDVKKFFQGRLEQEAVKNTKSEKPVKS